MNTKTFAASLAAVACMVALGAGYVIHRQRKVAMMQDEHPSHWLHRQELQRRPDESLEAYRERQNKILAELDDREREWRKVHGEGITRWMPQPVGPDKEHKEEASMSAESKGQLIDEDTKAHMIAEYDRWRQNPEDPTNPKQIIAKALAGRAPDDPGLTENEKWRIKIAQLRIDLEPKVRNGTARFYTHWIPEG